MRHVFVFTHENKLGNTQAHKLFDRIHIETTVNPPRKFDDYVIAFDRATLPEGIEVVDLPLWYDVDDAATLDILKAELLGGMAPGFATVPGYDAGHTRDFLLALDMGLKAAVASDANAVEARDAVPREGAR